MKKHTVPSDGLEGLKAHGKSDAISGFLIFLIALPLCLAISKASGFPPIAGIYTAIIGGLIVSLFMGSRVTIKGPAAGLIAISVGAVEELGRGDNMKGYQLTLAVIVVAAVIQIIFGVLKAGKLGDFFPAAAVHGMLAAIGLIIIAKQIPVLLGTKASGREPLELFAEIPHLLYSMNPEVAFIGVISLVALFILPLNKNRYVRMIPPPMVVLVLAIPLAYMYDFSHEHDYTLGEISYHIIPGNLLVQLPDSFFGGITFPDFSEIFSIVSIKYIVMFALVGSLESILSAKAIDLLDPYKRKSDLNRDTLAVGVGNLFAGVVGGLPMISEIVRSSANINNGGKTRWANFFHGLFLLIFVALAAPLIEMIPNAALAAMLIYTGFRLASPREFHKTWKIGWDQLLIFNVTIFVTLATDLLVGIFAGVATQFILHFVAGVKIKGLFNSNFEVNSSDGRYIVKVKDSAIFSNYLSFKKCLENIQPGNKVVFDFSQTNVIDHTLLEHLHHFEEDYHNGGGHVMMQGLGKHRANSSHPLATRIFSLKGPQSLEFKLDNRQRELRDFAEVNEFAFYPTTLKSGGKFRDFPLQHGGRVTQEMNILSRYTDLAKIEISDIHLTQGAGIATSDQRMTVILLSDIQSELPNFTLHPESFHTRIFEAAFGTDIDFPTHPVFSNRYYLRGDNNELFHLFTPELMAFLETNPALSIECHRKKVLIFKEGALLASKDIASLVNFCEQFLAIVSRVNLIQNYQ